MAYAGMPDQVVEPTDEQQVAALRARQRLGLAIPAGLAAALAGAVGWAVFTYLTDMELGLVAVAVGALVGMAVRRAGRGVDPAFGILGGACAALGWALGTLLTVVARLAKQAGVPVIDALTRSSPSDLVVVAVSNADAIDLLFLAIAVYEGWKLSFAYRAR